MQTEPAIRLPLAAASPAYFAAQAQGARDFDRAACFAACPFADPDLRDAWETGWRAAQDAAEGDLLADAL